MPWASDDPSAPPGMLLLRPFRLTPNIVVAAASVRQRPQPAAAWPERTPLRSQQAPLAIAAGRTLEQLAVANQGQRNVLLLLRLLALGAVCWCPCSVGGHVAEDQRRHLHHPRRPCCPSSPASRLPGACSADHPWGSTCFNSTVGEPLLAVAGNLLFFARWALPAGRGMRFAGAARLALGGGHHLIPFQVLDDSAVL